MAERYTRLYSLQENLYQEGSPILISAGALLRDNSTGKLLAQLKFRNISDCVINAVKVKINAFDPAGTALNGVDSFSYLDLSVGKDGEFGQQKPIPLPDVTTRSFTVEIQFVKHSHGNYIPAGLAVPKSADNEVLETVHELNRKRDEAKKQYAAKIQAENKIVKKDILLSLSSAIITLCPLIYHVIHRLYIAKSLKNELIAETIIVLGMIIGVLLRKKNGTVSKIVLTVVLGLACAHLIYSIRNLIISIRGLRFRNNPDYGHIMVYEFEDSLKHTLRRVYSLVIAIILQKRKKTI